MTRTFWALLAWSADHGAPTTIVGILGVQTDDDTARVTTAVEWVPLEHEHALVWRLRLADTPTEQVPTHLDRWWTASPTAPAVPLEPTDSDTTMGHDLATAVAIQMDHILAAPQGQ